MREIKYQGYDDTSKKIYRVVRIHLDADSAIWWSPDFDQHRLFNAEHKPLRQYTGLKDKNGKDIYEGDIVRVVEMLNTNENIEETHRLGFKTELERGSRSIYGPVFVAPVIWNDYNTGFTLAFTWADTGEIDDHLRITPQETEIIGNIYENKELLK